MYYDYDDDDDDDLQRMLEGRDVDDEPQVSQSHKSKKQPLYDGHGDEEVIRDDEDLDDFIENDEDEDHDGRQEAGDRREDGADYDDEVGSKSRRDEEAVEAPSAKPKVKRVVLNPQPKLDADRLKSEKGLIQLVKEHEKIKLKGKGHEAEDLDRIMFSLEHWAHRLFPKLNFDDFLERCEQLGHKKAVSVFVKKIRLGMPLGISSEFVNDEEDDGVERGFDPLGGEAQPVSAEEAFDQLFGRKSGDRVDERFDQAEVNSSKRPEPPPLTDEQKAMIARKRLEALERRAQKLREEEEAKLEQEMETNENEPSHETSNNLLSTQELLEMF